MIHQTKPSKLVLTINNLLADLLNCQMLQKSNNAQPFPSQTFLLYGIIMIAASQNSKQNRRNYTK